MDSAREWRGGQRQLELLVDGMVARGHRVRVACPPDGALAARLGPLVLPIPAGPSLSAIPALRRHFAAFEPDLVAAHTPHALGVCALTGVAPVVHRRVDFRLGRGLASRWKNRRARAWIAVSEGVARVLVGGGVPSNRIHVVHDGVEALPPAAPASDLDGPRPLVGAVGALVPHKGHRYLLEAVARLPSVHVVLAGDGPLRGSLERQARRLGIRERVRFLGHREDVSAIFAALDLFVHPSVEEGMGQVVVEAMLAGVPVVVSRAGGLPEVVGDTAASVPPGDASALARAIRRCLDDRPPVDRARIRASTSFSVDRMVDSTVEIYAALVGESPDPLRGRTGGASYDDHLGGEPG